MKATIPFGVAAFLFGGTLAEWQSVRRLNPNVRLFAPRPPDGRRSTETASTEIENGATELPTTRKRREPATAFELPRLIRPQPLRCRQPDRKTASKPFYVQLAAYIFSSRYATTSQVLRRFPELLSTERTAQRHLQNMVNHGLIAIASTRGTSPNFPFVYFVTRKGIGFLKANIPNGDRFQIPATEERRSRGQSLHSLLHEVCVTEFALMLAKTAQSRGDVELLAQERRYFRSDRRLTMKIYSRQMHPLDDDTGWDFSDENRAVRSERPAT